MPSHKGLDSVKAVNDANSALVRMENQAFKYVRDGQKEKGVALLFSPEYNKQKEIYDNGRKAIHNAEEDYVEQMEQRHDYVDLPILSALFFLGIAFIVFSAHVTMNSQEKLRLQERLSAEHLRMAAVGKFSAGIAHEINNSLQPIMGLSEIIASGLKKEKLHDPRIVEYANIIFESARHAQEIVENVLSAARGSNSQLEKWDVLRVFRDAVYVSSQILPPTVRLTMDLTSIERCDISICVNKTDVTRIVTNLFKNASQAMNGQGDISVTAVKRTLDQDFAAQKDISPGSYVVLSVNDTGAGMAAKTIDRIFDPFFTTKENGQGTGLGLSTAYAIMKQYGGTILVESRPQKGSSFQLYFPVMEI